MNKEVDSKLGKTLRVLPTNELSLTSPLTTTKAPRISLLLYHQAGTKVVTLEPGRTMVVGRDPSVDVAIEDEGLSRHHAKIEVIEGEVWVEDLGSTNGSKLNGERIERERMVEGDELSMGSVTASIHVLAPTDLKLLGLDSHDHFCTALEDEVKRGKAFGRSAALMMLRHEQATGDLLVHLMSMIRQQLRPVDRLALYSDDTVELLLPEADRNMTIDLASRLQAAVGGKERSQLFFGIAYYPDSGTSAGALLNGSRKALMQASELKPIQFSIAQKRSWESRERAITQGPVIRNPAMIELFNTIQRLASSVIPVLLIGDTGTGKEVVARTLHESGNRHDKRMACINCGAIPATLVESVLFGHERGAFTGATQASKGIFEEADGGTILLDEVGELSASAQAALLRVLEVKTITRVGASKEIPVDVRIIAATHRDLEAMSAEGSFRQDLFYRLNAMTLIVPPLRERLEEIAPLVEQFITQVNDANSCNVEGIEEEAMKLLLQYPWPGNIRELRNAIERAVVIAREPLISIADLPQRVIGGPAPPTNTRVDPPMSMESMTPGDENLDYKQRLQQFEIKMILDALRRTGGNRTQAAELLKLPVRTLSHKMSTLKIQKGYGRQ